MSIDFQATNVDRSLSLACCKSSNLVIPPIIGQYWKWSNNDRASFKFRVKLKEMYKKQKDFSDELIRIQNEKEEKLKKDEIERIKKQA